MKECKWFNIYNVQHLAAYKHLSETGSWPEGFITDDIQLPHMWLSIINGQMATAWVEMGMRGDIFGIPSIDQ